MVIMIKLTDMDFRFHEKCHLSFTGQSLRKKSQDQMPWRISGGQNMLGCVIPEWSSKFPLLERGPYQ